MRLLEIKNLVKVYESKQLFKKPVFVKALRGIELSLEQGETLAVVGESGCGKSTLAKVLMKIEPASEGNVFVENQNLDYIEQKELPHHIQMIFQDPYSSLNPRKKIFDIIAEPLRIQDELNAEEIDEKVKECLRSVGLREELGQRYAHMLSGGQRQRVGIARALVTNPKVLICDEPVSALDVSVQAQVLNLLLDLQEQKNLSYLFISHDLGVVRFISHRVAVMYLGNIVEMAETKTLFNSPKHPYTQLLLASSPSVYKGQSEVPVVEGELPSPVNPPSGCAFRTRCPYANERCALETPTLRNLGGTFVACHNL